MTKQTGLGDNLYVAGVDLSGDIGSLGRVGGGNAPLPVTGIDKSAFERRGGLRDGGIEYSAWFNPESIAGGGSVNAAHVTLSDLPRADEITTYCRGTTLGAWAASLVGKQLNYDPTRGDDGSLTIAVSAQANGYGLEWGTLLTAGKRSDTGATSGTGVDFGAASSFGLQAYLHVFSFTGTDVTITLESSSDDAATDPYAAVTGGAFTQVTTAPTSERIQTARDASIERWLRVSTSTTGGFTECTFAVVVVVNDTEVLF